MKVFIEPHGDEIVGRARAEGDGIVGDAVFTIAAGEDLHGITYEELRQAAPCIVEVDEIGRSWIDRSSV